MQYMLLIYENEAAREKVSPEDMQKFFGAYQTYSKDMTDAGVIRAGNALQPTASATTVRLRNGSTDTSDGPFGQTSEQFTGYYVIDCADLDEALGWAAKCPSAPYGSIEVRPVMEM